MINETPQILQQTILEEANRLINGSRQTDYGPPEKSFARIAKLASILTEKELTAVDICWVMLATKLSREINSHKRDNLVDLAGYTQLMQILQEQDQFEIVKPAQLAPAPSMEELTKAAGVRTDYKENARLVGWIDDDKQEDK